MITHLEKMLPIITTPLPHHPEREKKTEVLGAENMSLPLQIIPSAQ
jgi:hypothetical protein